MVLGCGAHKCRATDIDHLNEFVHFHWGVTGGHLLEGVEVDNDHVYSWVSKLVQCIQIIRIVAAGEDWAVNRWVQSLDPPIEYLRMFSHRTDVSHFHPRFPEETCGPSCAEYAPTHRLKRNRERADSSLVIDTDERSRGVLAATLRHFGTCSRLLGRTHQQDPL